MVGCDLDERAVACATANGVEAYRGDLFAPLPRALEGGVDVVVGVVPYVPTPDLPLLQRDTLAFESPLSYDGGRDGTEILRRVLADSPRFLRRGGALLLELGGDEAEALRGDLARLGYRDVARAGRRGRRRPRYRGDARLAGAGVEPDRPRLDRVDPEVASRSRDRARTWRGRRPRDSASTAWATRPSPASGPPRTMKPASTSSSM